MTRLPLSLSYRLMRILIEGKPDFLIHLDLAHAVFLNSQLSVTLAGDDGGFSTGRAELNKPGIPLRLHQGWLLTVDIFRTDTYNYITCFDCRS